MISMNIKIQDRIIIVRYFGVRCVVVYLCLSTDANVNCVVCCISWSLGECVFQALAETAVGSETEDVE